MRLFSLLCSSVVAAGILTACSGSPSGTGATDALPQSSAGSQPRTAQRIRKSVQMEQVLHAFGASNADGIKPYAGLVNVGGTLYGTTSLNSSGAECGTFYSIVPPGTYSVLYTFGNTLTDGCEPYAAPINVGGILYGTTEAGGAGPGSGTVYKVTTSGTETVLHNFAGGSSDGSVPLAGLASIGSTLYGVTDLGGADNLGVVFKITTTGKESAIHSFAGGSDGEHPDLGGLINVKGTLYGTTPQGGTLGGGIVFSITRSGTENVLHSFGGSGDGSFPNATLLNVNGTLYGTTRSGGANGDGTIFSITTTGSEKVLYSFVGSPLDGGSPQGGVISVNGIFYGLAETGGASGNGLIYGLTQQGREFALYSFAGGSDGSEPYGQLVNVGGTFYGTTFQGGNGAFVSNTGTIFSFSL
jgi:uncharacterized repeat protein (TIGR03803 family)